YTFGANELHVIDALDFILAHLEKEYGLDIYRNTVAPYVPDGYKLLRAEIVFEAKIFIGDVCGSWIFEKPMERYIYESREGDRYVFIGENLHPIRSSSYMKIIVESCADTEEFWHSFKSPRSSDQKFHPFVEFGDSGEIER